MQFNSLVIFRPYLFFNVCFCSKLKIVDHSKRPFYFSLHRFYNNMSLGKIQIFLTKKKINIDDNNFHHVHTN